MNEDFGQASSTSSADLTPDSFSEVDDTGPDNETPAEVSKAMLGRIEREGRDEVWFDRVPNEATGGMGVETKHEEERKVVGVPEGLKALLSNLRMRGRIHHDHDEEHEMAGDASRLSVVDLKSGLLSDF